ncbi:ABC-type multidrug transport system, permease component [Myxococcus hansupus]|uniref:ABC-type multidrug transport system, permease component n=1 Tax=Pseudomyxococcus hansupus TaxID=1297742 RepID=A0A0H4WYG7_9BACT|nr:ABC transporter permease [Myxococcus hansupus]AKQ68471.1 ABC-type multidrug transport system, permease component [Myxococcus hansupus]
MNALGQLMLMRLRMLLRQPEVLFWTFLFPLVTSVMLGLAFRNDTLGPVRVAVAEGPGAQALVEKLKDVPELSAGIESEAAARRRLARGQLALVLLPGETPEALVDPSQQDGRTARLLVARALAAAPPDADASLKSTPVSEPGNRYIDFLIPGLLGLSLMSNSLWVVAGSLVSMRGGRLLKRLSATPMRRSHFFLSFMLARSVFALVEVLFFCAFARWLFGVPMFGSYATLTLVGLVGSLCFAALGVLVSIRARSEESMGGLVNLVSMPMMFLSGVFFASDNFPSWLQPVIALLPLTAVNDSLRAVMLDGAGLLSLATPMAVLAAWTVLPLVLALRLFRWT